MADKKTEAPIADVNGNGILDGQDLLIPLHAEAKSKRRSGARRVLETLGVEGLTDEVGDEAIQKGSYRSLMELAASMFSKRIAEIKSRDSEFWNEQRALIDGDALSSARKEQEHYDLNLTEQFIADFDRTFPGGVNIAAGDMKEVLGHFGELPAVTPGHQQKERDKNGKES